MKAILIKFAFYSLLFYIVLLILIFFLQEKLLFFPEKLDQNYPFNFAQAYEEVNIKTDDELVLNGLLFKAELSKGLIFFLHGNAGSLATWGEIAPFYAELGYDIFMLDYRGFGKSEGAMKNQTQAFEDVLLAYNHLKENYLEENIVVLGFSLGTGLATKIAATNHPKLLILQAPYYSLVDLMQHKYPFIPRGLLKYPFKTHEYIQQCEMPIVIFHGDQDELIYPGSSEKLKLLLRPDDKVIFLKGQGHNGITDNEVYQWEVKNFL